MTGAGYSGTPLPRKLGIKEGMTVALVDPPEGMGATLGPLPAGASLVVGLPGEGADMVVGFFTERARLAAEIDGLTGTVPPGGAVWVAWPKKASGVQTDITDHEVRATALPRGWVDVKVCALDATWTALKLVLRRELRPKG